MGKGSLVCSLRNANNLKDVDWLGKQDPYCILNIKRLEKKEFFKSSTAVDGGRNPEWNQTFTFPDVDGDDTLIITLWDRNLLFNDVIIGTVTIPLHTVAKCGSQSLDAPVITSKRNVWKGTVSVHLEYKEREQGTGPTGPVREPSARVHTPPEREVSPRISCERMSANPPGSNGSGAEAGRIVQTNSGRKCWDRYQRGVELGRGTFGSVVLGTDKDTGEEVAVKVISKKNITSEAGLLDIKREVQVLHHLEGHANIVTIKEVFEDDDDVCIAMELCAGGQLKQALNRRGRFGERDAAAVMKTLVSVVSYCHGMCVIHRDLKLENFLLSNNSPVAELKAADFGLSTFFKEGDMFEDIVGSALYLAPEVLRRRYSKEADLWSCGVILYVLLCGRHPFRGNSEAEVCHAIQEQPLDLTSDPWPTVSDGAKDVVRRLLTRDPSRRATATEILNHDWIRADAPTQPPQQASEVFARWRQFASMNPLKKKAMMVVAASLPEDVMTGADQLFQEMDQDGSGTVTVQEFVEAYQRKGRHMSMREANMVLKNIDTDGNGTIDREEFRAAMLTFAKLQEVDWREVFDQFDLDRDGSISKQELHRVLNGGRQEIQEILAEGDGDGDGGIDFPEFCILMRKREMC